MFRGQYFTEYALEKINPGINAHRDHNFAVIGHSRFGVQLGQRHFGDNHGGLVCKGLEIPVRLKHHYRIKQ